MLLILLLLSTLSACLREVEGVNMINGTKLVGNPYGEAVYIQKKPSTTICIGVIKDEKTVYTSSVCDVGLEPVDSYHVVEIPQYEMPPTTKTYNIETIRRGKEWPFDVKEIKLVEPVICDGCSTSNTLWIETFDDYSERFKLNSPAVVFGFGPPFKGGVVTYTNDLDCDKEYDKVREADWPKKFPRGGFCIFPGPKFIALKIPNKPRPVKADPGYPCDDSIGSPVKIDDYGRTLGIIIKGFCGTDKVAIGFGSYFLVSRNVEPDDWKPPTATTTTTTAPTQKPIETTTDDGDGGSAEIILEVLSITICFSIHVILGIRELF